MHYGVALGLLAILGTYLRYLATPPAAPALGPALGPPTYHLSYCVSWPVSLTCYSGKVDYSLVGDSMTIEVRGGPKVSQRLSLEEARQFRACLGELNRQYPEGSDSAGAGDSSFSWSYPGVESRALWMQWNYSNDCWNQSLPAAVAPVLKLPCVSRGIEMAKAANPPEPE